MALSDDEKATFGRLSRQLGEYQREHKRFDAYYEGTRRLEQLGLAVPPDLARFTTTVNWPRITVDSVEQRCNVEGFRLPGVDKADDALWAIWQANNLDEESQQGHLEAIMAGRSYVCIGTRKAEEPLSEYPLNTVESPRDVIHERDVRTGQVSAALRKLASEDRSRPEMATLYLPDVTIWLDRRGSRGWEEFDRDEHKLGLCPVVPLLNRPRLRSRYGVSEMADVIQLTDAAARALTNAQIATEVLAIPQRYVLGATAGDFVDSATGKPLTAWETYYGAVWAMTSKDAKVGQFAAADLKNFETIVNHYANLVSGVSGLPTRFYGQYTTNPPTEGSIVADETRLIQNAYRKMRSFGGSWELVQRINRRIMDGDWDPALTRMETMWASPETPTRAQLADSVVKLASATVGGVPIMPLEMAREELGWSKTKRDRARLLDEEAQDFTSGDPVLRAARALTAGGTETENAAAGGA